MDFILADKDKKELGQVELDMDMDIGDTNDYQFAVSLSQWEDLYSRVAYIYIPDTEYGGPVSTPETTPASNTVKISGDIWRKMLSQKIIEPPEGSAYRIVTGEANVIMKGLVDEMFPGLFIVPETNSGIQITSYQFDRYTDLLTGLTKMLSGYGARLDIKLRQGERHGFTIEVQAVPVADYSDSLEFSQDSKVKFTTKDCTRGINHLICLGQGELTDRLVVHLYVDADGNIGRTQTFFGADERAAVYDYGNAETEAELVKGGTERLESLKDYKEMTMEVADVAADIGDIVGGREYTTGFLIRREISQKIIKIERGRIKTQYKVGGKAKASSRVGGGNSSGTDPADVLTFDKVYPVGSIYMSVNNVNPGTLFGGTWAAWGTGRMPIGADPEDTDFSAVEKTGGAKSINLTHAHTVDSHYHMTASHALTLTEIPSHAHGENISYVSDDVNGVCQSRPLADAQTQAANSGTYKALNAAAGFRSYTSGQLETGAAGGGKAHAHGNTGNASPGTDSQLSSVQAILPPYITCYMWKRTA